MPSDALLNQTAPGVQTATFHSAGVTLGKAKILNDIYMRVLYSAAANASGANAWTFSCSLSTDGGASWSVISGAQPINLTTTPQSGELFLELPLNMPAINPFMASAPIVRLDGVLSGAGASPTINVTNVDVVPSSV